MDATRLRDAFAETLRRHRLRQEALARRQREALRANRIGIALLERDTTLKKIAHSIGIPRYLVRMILWGRPKGYKHRAAIARALGLSESVVFPDGGKRRGAKTRRAA